MGSQNRQKGFNLIELVIVVAIIAILSTIAVPSYQGYVAKARQKEALDLLGAYYVKAQAVRAEFGRFPGNFVATGFQPVGQLNHRVQAVDGGAIASALNDDACVGTDQACNCGGTCNNFRTWAELPPGSAAVQGVAAVPGGGPGCTWVLGTTDTTFVVGAAGWISGGAATPHRVYMNELKQIQMCTEGIY